MKPTYIHTGPDKLVSYVEKEYKPRTIHKVHDVNKKIIFKGDPEQCYEFLLKLRSKDSEYSMQQYENYLKYKKSSKLQ